MEKIKRVKIADVTEELKKLFEKELPARTAMDITKNITILSGELSDIQQIAKKIKPSEDLLEYETERMKILVNYALKDDNGEPIHKIDPILNVSIFDIPTDKIELAQNEISSLQEKDKYKQAIIEREKVEQDFKSMMEEEIELDLRKLNIDNLPSLTPKACGILEFLIQE